MKRRVLGIILALALCAGLGITASAETHLIVTVDDETIMSIDNYTGETKETYTYEGEPFEITFIHATAPATVTVLGDPEDVLLTFDGAAIGDLGSTIARVELPENKKSEDIEWLGEVPLATGELIPAHELDPEQFSEESRLTFIRPGSTFELDEGTYNIVSPYAWVQIYIVVTGENTVPVTPPATTLVARPTASTVLVDGEDVSFDAYNISDNNYFKLRDLAYVLNGSEKQFGVGWDGDNNAITLTSDEEYTAVGGEMASKGEGNKTPTPTTATIYLDGEEVSFTAYNIDGNNYFKLRDIGEAFDFGVTWDGENNTIVIDTSIEYTPE